MIPTPYQIYFAPGSEFVHIEMWNPEVGKYVSGIHNSETGWWSPVNDHLTRKDFKTAGSTW